jgi:hypothetical protein
MPVILVADRNIRFLDYTCPAESDSRCLQQFSSSFPATDILLPFPVVPGFVAILF